MAHKHNVGSKANSTVEKPHKKETIADVLGVSDTSQHVPILKALTSELVARRQGRQVFATVVLTPSSGDMKIVCSDDASLDEIIHVLETATKRVVEARYKANAKKQDEKDGKQVETPSSTGENGGDEPVKK